MAAARAVSTRAGIRERRVCLCGACLRRGLGEAKLHLRALCVCYARVHFRSINNSIARGLRLSMHWSGIWWVAVVEIRKEKIKGKGKRENQKKKKHTDSKLGWERSKIAHF